MSELGHSRHSRHPGVSGSPQERTFGQCSRLWVHARVPSLFPYRERKIR